MCKNKRTTVNVLAEAAMLHADGMLHVLCGLIDIE